MTARRGAPPPPEPEPPSTAIPAPDAGPPDAGPGPARPMSRRWTALVLTVLGGLTLVVVATGLLTVGLASWRFVHFIPLERPGRWAPVALAAVAALTVAAHLGLRNRVAARAAVTVGTVAALFALCDGAIANVGSSVDPDPVHATGTRVAASTGGRELVVHNDGLLHYRLRTTGLFGRESRKDVACTARAGARTRPEYDALITGYGAREIPAIKVNSARFADATHLEFAMTDGRTWTVAIDGIEADRMLNWCGGRSAEPG
ncbi:hypothetical protein [Dactylosporangium sp. NPDC005555]|uniref:hypothetical protein n=1 Tax=Dactylosporangium sp. NPDC005555 TaxID=3154889 RepID=UPI0033BF3026